MRPRRVLLVEDDESLRQLYRDAFQHHNFEVFEASDGEFAVTQALSTRPSTIILDLLLPRQGGMRVLKILRSLPETKYTPVIILTALPNPEYINETKDRVQGYYLKTEVQPKEIIAKVEDLIKD